LCLIACGAKKPPYFVCCQPARDDLCVSYTHSLFTNTLLNFEISLMCLPRLSLLLYAGAQLQQQAYAVSSAAAGKPVRDPAVARD
jgi:hypothetical protein